MLNYLFTFIKLLLIVVPLLGMTYLPNTKTIRPHPIFWRMIFSIAILAPQMMKIMSRAMLLTRPGILILPT